MFYQFFSCKCPCEAIVSHPVLTQKYKAKKYPVHWRGRSVSWSLNNWFLNIGSTKGNAGLCRCVRCGDQSETSGRTLMSRIPVACLLAVVALSAVAMQAQQSCPGSSTVSATVVALDQVMVINRL